MNENRKVKVSRISKEKIQEEKKILTNQEAVSKGLDKQTPEAVRVNQIVFGAWQNVDQVAGDIWSSIHSSLLEGYPLFAYKSTQQGSELVQIVVVKRFDPNTLKVKDYGVGMITTGYSALVPHVPHSYLEDVVLEDLKKYKIDKEIQTIFKQIIENEKARS